MKHLLEYLHTDIRVTQKDGTVLEGYMQSYDNAIECDQSSDSLYLKINENGGIIIAEEDIEDIEELSV